MNKINYLFLVLFYIFLGGCIAPTDKTVDAGTPDITECSEIEGVFDGAHFIPQSAINEDESAGEVHPDLFYIAWAQLDSRTDLRFPERGYDSTGFEDKLLVSRRESDGNYKTWQIYPELDNDCKDVEKVRIQSFDVAPDGKSLYIAMSKPVFSDDDLLKEVDLNPNRKLGIFKLDISSKKITPITRNYSVSYSYPTYIGDDNGTGHEMLLISKTVTKSDIPVNYDFDGDATGVLLDEYDRAPVPLIHTLDTVTGAVTRIGFNNSHQTEPLVINREGTVPLVVFTQWEHQATVNRFALWKMQIDGSDNFMFYGEEAASDDSAQNLYQAREIQSGPYKGYILMGQSARVGNKGDFIAEGHILMTKRENLDLRSDKNFLSKLESSSGTEYHLARNPEHYNSKQFVYAYRASTDNTYGIYTKSYPTELNASVDVSPGTQVKTSNNYHFMQPRSFYLPQSQRVTPGASEGTENRTSFTNDNLKGKSGFLVENLGASDNGVQNQLNGIDSSEISIQFAIPSHHFSTSHAIGLENSQELSIPSSKFISTESDGSLGIVLKEGLYVWKVNKKFNFKDEVGTEGDLWLPIRVERQEVSFVANRVNACNQCHQDRNQDVIDLYKDYHSIAQAKMQGDLSDVLGTDKDISDYNSTQSIPDFHKDIAPLFTKPGLLNGKSCTDCHNAKDKLNLSNLTGVNSKTSMYRTFVLGAHKVQNEDKVLAYQYGDINPLGMDDKYHPAPFLWSLMLDDDLTVEADDNHSNTSDRNLDRANDYGAQYDTDVISEINRINGDYNHSKHWSLADTQKIITYGSTRLPVGLSDKISFSSNALSTQTPQAQKAYQALIRNCYECHNTHTSGGLGDSSFTDIIPKEKRFNNSYYLRDSVMRFGVYRYLTNKGDTKFSQSLNESNLNVSRSQTLSSALYRIDFNDLNNSELLVYARGSYQESNGTETVLNSNIHDHTGYMSKGDSDYKALWNWVNGVVMDNEEPKIEVPTNPIVIKEYAAPAFLEESLTWKDEDGDLSQLVISGSSSSEHTFNDTMLALKYNSFTSANLKAYAILGDRGDHNFTFAITDGLDPTTIHNVPVTVTSDYIVPEPSSVLPNAYLFFTDRNTNMLKKLDTNGTVIDVGIIEGFSPEWTTMYRRADKGWLYFLSHESDPYDATVTQKVYVVDENNASVLFNININHEPNRVGTSHKQTIYLLWWRPAEGNEGDSGYEPAELQGLLESKLSTDASKNGDKYISLGGGENNVSTVIPQWKHTLPDGGNTVGVYVWRQATFMTKWVNGEIDRMNVLNLVTGKSKYMTDFSFTAQTIDGVDYSEASYFNVRALVVAEDGAFYGFNKDLNVEPEAFNFDPIKGIQAKVNIPLWLQTYINDYQNYSTPFLVIEPRE